MPSLPTTQWSLIHACAPDNARATAAWGELVETYRGAIRVYFERSLRDPDTADDLTQAFIADSMAHGWWARADAERGSFRRYLFVLLSRYRSKHLRGRQPDSGVDPEALPETAPSASHAYDLAFIAALTDRALRSLEADYVRRGRRELFGTLAALLAEPPAHGELQNHAASLGVKANTLTVELRRLRQRLRQRIREEVEQTCSDSEQLAIEIRLIRECLG